MPAAYSIGLRFTPRSRTTTESPVRAVTSFAMVSPAHPPPTITMSTGLKALVIPRASRRLILPRLHARVRRLAQRDRLRTIRAAVVLVDVIAIVELRTGIPDELPSDHVRV